jgi:hypothetical protein
MVISLISFGMFHHQLQVLGANMRIFEGRALYVRGVGAAPGSASISWPQATWELSCLLRIIVAAAASIICFFSRVLAKSNGMLCSALTAAAFASGLLYSPNSSIINILLLQL